MSNYINRSFKPLSPIASKNTVQNTSLSDLDFPTTRSPLPSPISRSSSRSPLPSPISRSSSRSPFLDLNDPNITKVSSNKIRLSPKLFSDDKNNTIRTEMLSPNVKNLPSPAISSNANYKHVNIENIGVIKNKIRWQGYLSDKYPLNKFTKFTYPEIENLILDEPLLQNVNIITADEVLPQISTWEVEQEHVISVFDEIDIKRVTANKAYRIHSNKYDKNNGPYSIKYIMEIASKLGIPINNNKEAIVNSIHEYYRKYIDNNYK
jgi:hypothetical protein